MEVPRQWREMPVSTGFVGIEKKPTKDDKGNVIGVPYYKYPGGEIPLAGSMEEVYDRFERKGFKPEVIEEILLGLVTVPTKATVPMRIVIESRGELVGCEVRK